MSKIIRLSLNSKNCQGFLSPDTTIFWFTSSCVDDRFAFLLNLLASQFKPIIFPVIFEESSGDEFNLDSKFASLRSPIEPKKHL